MSRIIQAATLVLLICLCILGVAALGTFLYVRYGDAPSRVSEVESRMKPLESRPEWTTRHYVSHISTTDRPASTNSWDECRLVYGTNSVQTFSLFLGKESGHIVTAWISDWTPRSEMTKFEEFRVSKHHDAQFDIAAKVGTNESVAMDFTVTFIIAE
jgi:hypothetical protein